MGALETPLPTIPVLLLSPDLILKTCAHANVLSLAVASYAAEIENVMGLSQQLA